MWVLLMWILQYSLVPYRLFLHCSPVVIFQIQRRSDKAAPGLRPRFEAADSVGLVTRVMVSGLVWGVGECGWSPVNHFSTNSRLVNFKAVSKWRQANVTVEADKSNEVMRLT